MSPIMHLVAILSFLLIAARVHATITTVVTGEIPERLSSRPTYRILLPEQGEYLPRPEEIDETQESDMEEVRMVTAQGQALLCGVPRPPSEDSYAARHVLGPTSYDDVDELLSSYRSQCYMRREGWWTFEFCYNDKILQYHEPSAAGERADRFVLGAYNAEYNENREPADIARPDAAFTQLYGNGTLCDLTGKPRETLVKYVCADDTAQMSGIVKQTGELFLVKGIREVASCVYELEFVSSAVCKQKLYRNRARKAALDITCEMAPGQHAFRGLAASSHRKGKASLTL